MLQATWQRVGRLADGRADRRRQRSAPLPGRRTVAPGRCAACRASCSNRSAATPRRRSPPRRCRRWPMAGIRCCSCCPRTTWSPMSMPSAPRCAKRASPRRSDGALVTFGIVPTAPETGFGYIQAEATAHGRAPGEALRREARRRHGAAVSRCGRLLLEQRHVPVPRLARSWKNSSASAPTSSPRAAQPSTQAKRDGDFVRLDRDAFAACPSDSIDYAVMERTDAAMVLPVDIGWNDVGSWSALWDVTERDADGNAHHGDVIAVDSRNSYAYARRLVALVGVDDLVVVETDDAVLVARKDRVQQVKDVVAQLKAAQRSAGRAASRSASAVGQLRLGGCRRRFPGQAHQGQAGRDAVAAVASRIAPNTGSSCAASRA